MRILIVAAVVCAAGAAGALAQTASAPAKPATPPKAAAPPTTAALPTKGVADNAMSECMRMWDRGTHITNLEWTRTCKRVQSRLDNLKVENLDVMGLGVRKKTGREGGTSTPSRPN